MGLWDRRAVGGFSEELPAMLVVLVAVSLFIASAAQAYASWDERQRDAKERERVETFAARLCAEPNLTWHGRLAMFDSARLADANCSAFLRSAYSADALGFEYSVSVSGIDGAEIWRHASAIEPEGASVVRASRACNVVEADGLVRPCLLEVEAWRRA
jgi:hypothetical protein